MPVDVSNMMKGQPYKLKGAFNSFGKDSADGETSINWNSESLLCD